MLHTHFQRGEKHIPAVISLYNCVQDLNQQKKSQFGVSFQSNFAATPRTAHSGAVHSALRYVSCKRSGKLRRFLDKV